MLQHNAVTTGIIVMFTDHILFYTLSTREENIDRQKINFPYHNVCIYIYIYCFDNKINF